MVNVEERAKCIALVISDNDGVLTDGTVYVAPDGEVMKAYSVRDGLGVERLRQRNIHTGLLTREPLTLVAARADKLELRHLWVGVRDKRAHLPKILDDSKLSPEQLAYIGDDVNDLELIEAINATGLTAAPADAMPQIRAAVHYVCQAPGGRGAFREFAEWILRLRSA
jgi:3-deoxy-D-manno-octulosonate 8-phosphate phosphatase (KDO 8-P phosphatase)